MTTSALVKPLIFGAIDGMTCAIGVILSLHHHAGLVFAGAFGVAVAEFVGMGAGEWLSDENPHGFTSSAAIGAASAIGAVLPALPYLMTSGALAIAMSVTVLIVVCGLISVARAEQRGFGRAVLETYGVLAVVFAAVLGSGLLTPGGS